MESGLLRDRDRGLHSAKPSVAKRLASTALATKVPMFWLAVVTVLFWAAAVAGEQKLTWPGQAEEVLARADLE